MVQGKPVKAGSACLTGRQKQKQKGKAITQRKAGHRTTDDHTQQRTQPVSLTLPAFPLCSLLPALLSSAPHIHRRHSSVTAAINRRNEALMAARLAHEGGTLAIIPRPERVDRYEKGGARTGERQSRQLFQSSMARHARLRREGQAVGDVGAKAGGGGDGKRGSLPVKRKRGLKEGVRQVGDDWFDEADAELERLSYDSEDEDEQQDGERGRPLGDERRPDAEQREERKEKTAQAELGTDDAGSGSAASVDAAAAVSSERSAASATAATRPATASPRSASAAEPEQESRPTKQQRTGHPKGRGSTSSRPSAAPTLPSTTLSHTLTS